MNNLLGRFAKWAMGQLVSDDPWEPRIAPGQFVLRERRAGEVVPREDVAMLVCATAEEVVAFVARHGVEKFFVTTLHRDGQYETADERSAWRVIGRWQFKEPEIPELPALSPGEIAALLLEREARAA